MKQLFKYLTLMIFFQTVLYASVDSVLLEKIKSFKVDNASVSEVVKILDSEGIKIAEQGLRGKLNFTIDKSILKNKSYRLTMEVKNVPIKDLLEALALAWGGYLQQSQQNIEISHDSEIYKTLWLTTKVEDYLADENGELNIKTIRKKLQNIGIRYYLIDLPDHKQFIGFRMPSSQLTYFNSVIKLIETDVILNFDAIPIDKKGQKSLFDSDYVR